MLNENELIWFQGERILNNNTHGTGCTLSSAIACGLAKDKSIQESVRDAKTYISDCIKAQLNLGDGNGPILHTCRLK